MIAWRKRIEFRSRIAHVLVASVVGFVLQIAIITAVFSDRVVQLSGWWAGMMFIFLLIPVVVLVLPTWFGMIVSWGLRPMSEHSTGWRHAALVIASVTGGVIQFLFMIVPLEYTEGRLPCLQWFGTWVVSTSFALLVLRLLRPNGPRPRLPSRRRRRGLAGKCETCGYDLTGSESGICPECGSFYAEERCRYCDYDLTGNTSGVCPECGSNVGASLTA